MLAVREASIDDAAAIGRIHYETWMDTYKGLIAPSYLDKLSAEKSTKMVRENVKGYLVACLEGEIAGFARHIPSRDGDMPDAGEIQAVYIHPLHQDKGIGKKLMQASLKRMRDHERILVWVHAENKKAIRFYRDLGFFEDGAKKQEKVDKDTYIEEIRLVLER